MQALTQVNRYWGIINVGWVPLASLGAASVAAIMGMFLWYMTDSKNKPGLLAGQISMQVLCAGCMLLALLCWLHPSKVDPQVSAWVHAYTPARLWPAHVACWVTAWMYIPHLQRIMLFKHTNASSLLTLPCGKVIGTSASRWQQR